MTRAAALREGFTHEGWFAFLPIWYRESDSSIVGKFWLADRLVLAVAAVDVMVGMFVLDPHFALRVRPIEREAPRG